MGCIAYHTTPLGRIMLAAEGDALVGLWMEGQKYFAGSLKGEFRERNDFPVLVRGREWLDRYFAGEKPHVSELKLDPAGSEFRKAVWKILCQIPYGEVTTYGEIAKKIAVACDKERMSSQAVGGAVGHNAISIIIPCHRVVGAGGSLTGYAGGIDKKIMLLAHEGVYSKRFFVPKKSAAP
ncbi:methylated-DNA--[protein]-cysteine S-methyltransferase [Desulfovibrio sp. 3_1_syn3]|uniref:methylated-DNA--[protein]-cysteine S-methyltransferase n=1 Tax=Desulfovibrio sp. 3_1_syn3 TaxID=457398 RepID=UPI0001E12C9D